MSRYVTVYFLRAAHGWHENLADRLLAGQPAQDIAQGCVL